MSLEKGSTSWVFHAKIQKLSRDLQRPSTQLMLGVRVSTSQPSQRSGLAVAQKPSIAAGSPRTIVMWDDMAEAQAWGTKHLKQKRELS